jgi:hypothetical protein
MNRSVIVEFRDPDGSYVLALALDEIRCRVLRSNVAERGAVLFKNPDLGWEKASEDLGGLTRLGPADLVPSRELAAQERTVRQVLEEVPDPESGGTQECEDPRALRGRRIRGRPRLSRAAVARLLARGPSKKKLRRLRRLLPGIRTPETPESNSV